jgi:hypothetical protein
MSKNEKLLQKLLQGSSDGNFSFDELCRILNGLDFESRIKGSHHIYFRKDIEEIINIQPDKSKAKPYQIKQVRNIILKNKLHLTI